MLQFEPGLAIYTIITFLVLFVMLWKTAWPKILSAIEERETKIRTSLENAEKARQEAERTMAEYKKMIANARQESAEIIKESSEKAEKVREDLIAAAKADAVKLIENTKKELEREQQKAVQEMKARTVDISISIAERIIRSSLTRDQQLELARKALQDMEMN
ncbi:F0F1 ATP synthase subunit B [candidate division KSB1 bacterium]